MNTIQIVDDENGGCFPIGAEMGKVFTVYYKNLFETSNPTRRVGSNEMKINLTQDFQQWKWKRRYFGWIH